MYRNDKMYVELVTLLEYLDKNEETGDNGYSIINSEQFRLDLLDEVTEDVVDNLNLKLSEQEELIELLENENEEMEKRLIMLGDEINIGELNLSKENFDNIKHLLPKDSISVRNQNGTIQIQFMENDLSEFMYDLPDNHYLKHKFQKAGEVNFGW